MKPFLKWSGGKGRLVPAILAELPEQIEHYVEPFVGGGAVFFALASAGRIKRATLSDSNAELVNTYRTVRGDVEGLLTALAWHAKRDSEAHYYATRSSWPGTPVRQAARTIYLNKTCFNGLYRVNRSGEFNASWGKRTFAIDGFDVTLREASKALRGVALHVRSYRAALLGLDGVDAIYCDPPYYPLTATANFTAYTPAGFCPAEHESLRRWAHEAARRGATVVLSNSVADGALQLYAHDPVQIVSCDRRINSNAEKRGPVAELLVTLRPPGGAQ